MKVCLSATAKTLESNLDPRFGRCPYFLIYDTGTQQTTFVDNTSQQSSGGAGIKAAEAVAHQQVNLVITGNIGPNAYRTLQAADIQVITGASGSLQEVLENYQKGLYKKTAAPTVESHHGMR